MDKDSEGGKLWSLMLFTPYRIINPYRQFYDFVNVNHSKGVGFHNVLLQSRKINNEGSSLPMEQKHFILFG